MAFATPKVDIDLAAMERHLDFLENTPRILTEVSLEVAKENEESLLDELGAIPPKPNQSPKWVSDAQRVAVIMKLKRQFKDRTGHWPRKGDDWSYQRTGKSPMGWEIHLDQQNEVVRIIIQNIWNKARFVFGNLSGDAKGSQQPFHSTTGWPFASPIVSAHLKEMNAEILKRYKEQIKQERRKR